MAVVVVEEEEEKEEEDDCGKGNNACNDEKIVKRRKVDEKCKTPEKEEEWEEMVEQLVLELMHFKLREDMMRRLNRELH